MFFLPLLATLLQVAAAAPAADLGTLEAAPLLAKRGDGIHFVNCDAFGGEGTVLPKSSYVVYCPNDSNCSSFPSSNNLCTMSSDSWVHWEGKAMSCTFPTGTKFQWFLNGNAQSQPTFSHVGDGGNQFRAYQGFKDDQHFMFLRGSAQCHSIYYWV